MPQLEVDGAALTYDDEGPRDGDGVPLVFIHGWTANRHRWDHQLDHFTQKRRVVRLDLRGHGESGGRGAGPWRNWPVTYSPCSTTWNSTGSYSSDTRWAG